MAKTIQELRREKGYRSAREFADALGISPSSMSRYDNQPDSIPVKVAWQMADRLDCSIDEVVGRMPVTSGKSELQEFYDGLLAETRELMDDLIEFARMKDEATRRKAKAESDRRAENQCRFYERMFLQAAYESAEFGEVVDFGTPAQERAAFERYLLDQAAAKRKPGIDLHCEGLEMEMRENGRFEEDEIQKWLDEERTQMDEEYGKRDGEVIDGIMEAYDRLHEARSIHLGPRTTIEYVSTRLT